MATVIDPNKDLLLEYYQHRCVRCHQTQNVTLHEISPKSLNPKKWQDPGNRVALCLSCHDLAHKYGTRNSRKELLDCLSAWQVNHGTFEDWLGVFA